MLNILFLGKLMSWVRGIVGKYYFINSSKWWRMKAGCPLLVLKEYEIIALQVIRFIMFMCTRGSNSPGSTKFEGNHVEI